MKHAMKVNGSGNMSRHAQLCWACPGYTFNAGHVCSDCLDAGLDPVPPELRETRRPTVFGAAIAAVRRRLTGAEFDGMLNRLRGNVA